MNPRIEDLMAVGPPLNPVEPRPFDITPEFVRLLHGHLDVTSLDTRDSPLKIIILSRAARETPEGALPVSSVCVYPTMVVAARMELEDAPVHVTTVAGGFPHGLSTLEAATADVQSCAAMQVREIEVAIPLYMALAGDFGALGAWIREMRKAAQPSALKVIIRAGEIGDRLTIYRTALCALEAGADFISNSTGLESASATVAQTEAMMLALWDFRRETDHLRGLKLRGNVDRVEQVAEFWDVAVQILGEDELFPTTLRIGAELLLDDIRNRLVPA